MTLPSDLSNLLFWYKADAITGLANGAALSGNATLWPDSGPNGWHITSFTGTCPTWSSAGGPNGLPSVTFNNTGLLNLPTAAMSAFQNKGGGTLYMVVRTNSSVAEYPFYASSGDGTYHARFVLQHNSGTGPTRPEAIVARRTDAASSVQLNGPNITDNTYAIEACYADWTNNALNIWLNGGTHNANNAAWASGGNTDNTASNSITIGGQYKQPSGTTYITGDVVEVFAFDRVLTSTEQQQMDSYLSSRTLIPIPVSADSSLATTATLSAVAASSRLADASLSTTTTQSATAGRIVNADSSLATTATQSADASRTAVVNASLAVTATQSADTSRVTHPDASLTATVTLSADMYAGDTIGGSLPVTTTSTAGAGRNTKAAASLAATATLTATVSTTLKSANASLAVTTGLSAAATQAGHADASLEVTVAAGATVPVNTTTPPPPTITATWPLTAAEIACLQADSLVVDVGLELLDANDVVTSDISENLIPAGSEVDRDNYATIHGTCKLNLSQPLQWGAARVRPYMVLTGAGASVRWNLGVYILTTPDRPVGETPETYAAVGYDKLYLLNQVIGDTYAVSAGSNVLAAVNSAISAAGVGGQVNIDGTASTKTLAADIVWPLNEQNQATYLRVINDLLATVGYRGMWADRDGALRADPYILPSVRPTTWDFSADDPYTSLVGLIRTETQDLWPVPNHWLFIQRGLTTAPTEGAGQYTYQTPDTDPTSAKTLGITKRKVVFLDAADQASLQAQGDQIVATDRQVTQTIALTTAPFPVEWHFDCFNYADSALGDPVKVQSESWALPLDGSDMTHKFEVVS